MTPHETANAITPGRAAGDSGLDFDVRFESASLGPIANRLRIHARPERRRKVLVIDDNADVRLGLTLRLHASGYDTAVAADAVSALAVNDAVTERVAFLRPAHPTVTYDVRLATDAPVAFAAGDLVKSILTNLLENAAEAAGDEGTIRVVTSSGRDRAFSCRHCVFVEEEGGGRTVPGPYCRNPLGVFSMDDCPVLLGRDCRQFAARATIRFAPIPYFWLNSVASSPTVMPCRAGIGYIPTNDWNFGSSSAPSMISPPMGLGRSRTTNGRFFLAAACIESAIVET